MNLAILSFLSYTWFFTAIAMVTKEVWFYFRHHGSTTALTADDLEE